MPVEALLRIEVVYALPEEQIAITLSVPQGTTAAQAIERSGLADRFAEVTASPIGIFGRVVEPDSSLSDGDRVEVYRPLLADPKQARRRRAAGSR
jgi:putative ubiquitin-RnfH superfamily antitoxin RatB of RatAB toxin-antitoxin module